MKNQPDLVCSSSQTSVIQRSELTPSSISEIHLELLHVPKQFLCLANKNVILLSAHDPNLMPSIMLLVTVEDIHNEFYVLKKESYASTGR